eukprot:2936554-Pyramimonas_sp.AAC.1
MKRRCRIADSRRHTGGEASAAGFAEGAPLAWRGGPARQSGRATGTSHDAIAELRRATEEQ